MSETSRMDQNLSLKSRQEEFGGIQRLLCEFGDIAYRAVDRYHRSLGYEAGYDTILEMVTEGSLSKAGIRADPTQAVLSILKHFFEKRGGNQPSFSIEGDTVHLTTCADVYCPAPFAQDNVGLAHCDICFVHKRSFADGLASAICEFLPGLKVQAWNFVSRNLGQAKHEDCTEAYRVIPAWGRASNDQA